MNDTHQPDERTLLWESELHQLYRVGSDKLIIDNGLSVIAITDQELRAMTDALDIAGLSDRLALMQDLPGSKSYLERAILAVDGVTEVSISEGLGFGIVSITVTGGDERLVGEVILMHTPATACTEGDIEVAYESHGTESRVRFSRPEVV